MQIFSGNPEVVCQQLAGQCTAVRSATPNSTLFIKHFQTKLKKCCRHKNEAEQTTKQINLLSLYPSNETEVTTL